MHKFSSADTALLLRLASSLPTGDESRRAILSSLSGGAFVRGNLQHDKTSSAWEEVFDDDDHFFILKTPDGSYIFRFFSDWDGNEKPVGALVWTGGQFGEDNLGEGMDLARAKRIAEAHYKAFKDEKASEIVEEKKAKTLREQLLDFADRFRSGSGDYKSQYEILLQQATDLGFIDNKLRLKLNRHNRGVGNLKGGGPSDNELMAQGLEMIVKESVHDALKTATDEGALELPGHTMAPDEWNPTMPAFSMQGNSVDRQLQASALGADFERVRELTDQVRGAKALPLPVPSGTRVTFAGHFGSVFAYENPPQKGAVGEVVTVRSATGDITSHGGMVFVKWADGTFLPVHAEHLRVSVEKPPRVARHFTAREIPADVNRFKVAGLGDISQFLSKVSNDTLVHKSQKDLWSFSKGADGGLTVQRLFSSDGEPLKG